MSKVVISLPPMNNVVDVEVSLNDTTPVKGDTTLTGLARMRALSKWQKNNKFGEIKVTIATYMGGVVKSFDLKPTTMHFGSWERSQEQVEEVMKYLSRLILQQVIFCNDCEQMDIDPETCRSLKPMSNGLHQYYAPDSQGTPTWVLDYNPLTDSLE